MIEKFKIVIFLHTRGQLILLRDSQEMVKWIIYQWNKIHFYTDYFLWTCST